MVKKEQPEKKIDLKSYKGRGPKLLDNDAQDLKKAYKLVLDNHEKLLKAWELYHEE